MEGKLEDLKNKICKARGYTKGNDEPCVYHDLLEDGDTGEALSVTDEVLELVVLQNATLQSELEKANLLVSKKEYDNNELKIYSQGQKNKISQLNEQLEKARELLKRIKLELDVDASFNAAAGKGKTWNKEISELTTFLNEGKK